MQLSTEIMLAPPDARLSLQAFLGAGGTGPRLDALNLAQNPWSMPPSWPLPPGESVYAIAAAVDGETLAVGGRRGGLYLLTPAGGSNGDAPYDIKELHRGAPILALCWVNKGLLAAADAERQCLLWDVKRPDIPPQNLATGEECTYALQALNESTLAGLTAGGKLLFWQTPEGVLTESRRVPAPPPKGACVNLIHWAACGALAYPAAGGDLARYDLATEELSAFHAHEGEFYALAVLGNELLTAGLNDRYLRGWRAGTSAAVYEAQIPEGMVSMAVLDEARKMVLLVDRRGRAFVCALMETGLQELSRIEGADYRVAIGPSANDFAHLRRWQNEREAALLIQQITDQLERRRHAEARDCINRLAKLGLEREAQEFRIALAIAEGDCLEELRARLHLTRLIPPRAESIPEFLLLAQLLERLGQFDEALAVYQRVLSIDPRQPIAGRVEQLAAGKGAIESDCCIIRPDDQTTMQQMTAAATLLDRRCRGRFQIGGQQLIHCPEVSLTPAQIIRKYDELRSSKDARAYPPATQAILYWNSDNGVRQAEAISFQNNSEISLLGLELSIVVESPATETICTCYLLLNAGRLPQTDSLPEHNAAVLKAYQSIISTRLRADSWNTGVLRLFIRALRRLRNQQHNSVM